MKIKVVTGKKGLSLIQDDWHQISRAFSNKRFFHLYEWYQSYLEHLEKTDTSLVFFLVCRQAIPLAIFPLKKTNRKMLGFNFRTLETPSHDYLDLSDFICADPEDISGLFQYLLVYLCREYNQAWDFIVIPRALDDSKIIQGLKGNKHIPLTIIETAGTSNFIQCRHAEAVQKRIPKKFKANLKRWNNKIKGKNVRFESSSTLPDILESYKIFLEIEASGWKGKQRTAIKYSPDINAYYKSLILNFARLESCEINLLEVNERYIAGQLCINIGDICYLLKIGYDENYSYLAPGNLLLENLIMRLAKSKQINYMSFVTGTAWQKRWNPDHIQVNRLYCCRKSLSGLIAFSLIKIKHLAKNVYMRIDAIGRYQDLRDKLIQKQEKQHKTA